MHLRKDDHRSPCVTRCHTWNCYEKKNMYGARLAYRRYWDAALYYISCGFIKINGQPETCFSCKLRKDFNSILCFRVKRFLRGNRGRLVCYINKIWQDNSFQAKYRPTFQKNIFTNKKMSYSHIFIAILRCNAFAQFIFIQTTVADVRKKSPCQIWEESRNMKNPNKGLIKKSDSSTNPRKGNIT